MKHMLLIYRDEGKFGDGRSGGEHSAVYMEFARSMSEAGVLVSGHRLQPSASTVRLVQGRASVTDGHDLESAEQLGGLYVIDVANTGEAQRWASRCPGAAQGAVEVRPIWE